MQCKSCSVAHPFMHVESVPSIFRILSAVASCCTLLLCQRQKQTEVDKDLLQLLGGFALHSLWAHTEDVA